MGEEEFLQLSQDVLGLSNERIDPPELKGLVDTIPDLVNTAIDNAKTAIEGAASGATWRTADGGVDTVSLTDIPLNGLQNINGVPNGVDIKVLVAGQSNKAQNGLYLMKSGFWLRIPGYDTGPSLSSLFVGVMSGTYAGSIFMQPSLLATAEQAKDFTLALDLKSSLVALASMTREESRDFWIPVTTESQSTFYLTGIVPTGTMIRRVLFSQPDIDKLLKPNTDWVYNKTTHAITLSGAASARVHVGNELILDVRSNGTQGLFEGLYLEAVDSQLYYRFGFETNADLRPIPGGTLNVTSGFISVDTYEEVLAEASGSAAKMIDHKGGYLYRYTPGRGLETTLTFIP